MGAFATSQIVFLKEIGVGAVVAVLVDAFVVRALLVPSLMALLGERELVEPPAIGALPCTSSVVLLGAPPVAIAQQRHEARHQQARHDERMTRTATTAPKPISLRKTISRWRTPIATASRTAAAKTSRQVRRSPW